ncbi:short-chain dehydrogenase/reductase family 42E member 1-like [Liolophura sinensis]|uniref:short-chain dehydrogenase/reductase family 42E member 1-like n=1 Tax=Liolophura sinensis TaxID=3198878 RepID=UPI0031580F8B
MNEEDRIRPELHLITGGCGYPGFNLAKKLVGLGHKVRLFDVKEPIWSLPENVELVKGDIRNLTEVEAAFEDVDCAYHLASYGMSGREQLNKKLIEEINILGTKNVIKACCKRGVSRLVYTSTYNVVFGGQVIINGDESLPYLPLDQHPDHYSRTKALAEIEVIKANGSSIKGNGTLRTCALRLAGVYGPGELRHLPRIVSYLEMGMFRFTYGKSTNLVDFLHVDNLVQVHFLAAQALTQEKGYVAAGQAYFISDNKPVNNFEFFRPLVEGLGYDFPSIKLPMILVYFLAYLTEWLHFFIGHIYNFQPMLTRTEVYKTGVTHYFSVKKAKRDLGYTPVRQNDMGGIVEYFRKTGHTRARKRGSDGRQILISLLLAILCAIAIMAFIPVVV